MQPSHRLGELQHAIMRVLWRAGEASVAEVQKALSSEHPRALTTIATMLVKMEKKGVCTHRSVGRQFVYRPTVSEDEVTRSMVADLTAKLFAGDASALVGHLLREEEFEVSDLARLKRLIATREKQEKEEGESRGNE